MYAITLTKHGATWYYVTRNPEGGSFGSNNCGPQYVALARARNGVPSGASYTLTINGRSRGTFIR